MIRLLNFWTSQVEIFTFKRVLKVENINAKKLFEGLINSVNCKFGKFIYLFFIVMKYIIIHSR